jgi:hypothetical protein
LHFEQFVVDSLKRRREAADVIHGTQRTASASDFGNDAIGSGPHCLLEQGTQESCADTRHIAGNENIPLGMGMLQGRHQSAQRTAVRNGICKYGISEMSVAIGWSDQGHRSGRRENFRRDVLDQRRASEGQQRLVTAHPRAMAPRQNKAGFGIGRDRHEMILTSPETAAQQRTLVDANKKVYICFLPAVLKLAVLIMLAASPMRAAEPVSAPAAVAVRKTLVVRADPRTGKLVRSTVVAQRPAANEKPVTPAKFTPVSADASKKAFNEIVERASKAHDVDPLLVHSIIKVESNYNPNAVSNKGAEGLMQLTRGTARMLGVNNSFDTNQNI